jgi:hypothetical protein
MNKGYNTIDVTNPKQGWVVVREVYWLCKDGDEKQAIFFNDTAQCNKNIQIPERMLEYTKQKTGWDIQIVFIDMAFRPMPKF